MILVVWRLIAADDRPLPLLGLGYRRHLLDLNFGAWHRVLTAAQMFSNSFLDAPRFGDAGVVVRAAFCLNFVHNRLVVGEPFDASFVEVNGLPHHHSLVLLVILYAYTVVVVEEPPPGQIYILSFMNLPSTAV